MGHSEQFASVITDAADNAFQIRCLKRSAYTAVLRAFFAQSDLLSRAKEGCLTELRNDLKILETEHRECLGKARSNKQINSLSAVSHSKGSSCSTEVMKDTPDLACVLSDAGDTVFQIHCLERSAYASVLRAFCSVTNYLSWLQVKLLTKLRNELRISHVEHKEVLVKVSSNEYIKSLRKFSLAHFSVCKKTGPALDVHAMVHDKIGSARQVSTSSTSCTSFAQQSAIPKRSMSSTRGIGITGSSNRANERPCFEPHAVLSAKRLKSVEGPALASFKCTPEQLPMAVSTTMVKGYINDTLDRAALSIEVKSGCTSTHIVQEKHSQSNADHARKESGKRKIEVPVLRESKSLGVMDRKYWIKYQRRKSKKDPDLEHGSGIIKLCLTASLLNKVERLFRENPDPANLEEAKSILKAQEKVLLDALVKLSEVSYDVACFSDNGQLANLHEHDNGKGDEEAPPKAASSTDETSTETRLGGGGAGEGVKIQGVAVGSAALSPSATNSIGATAASSSGMPLLLAPSMPGQTRTHAPASPSSAPAALAEPSRGPASAVQLAVDGGSASAPPAPSKKRCPVTTHDTS